MQSLDVLSKRRYFTVAQLLGHETHHPVRIVRALADPELFELLFGVLGVLPGEAKSAGVVPANSPAAPATE